MDIIFYVVTTFILVIIALVFAIIAYERKDTVPTTGYVHWPLLNRETNIIPMTGGGGCFAVNSNFGILEPYNLDSKYTIVFYHDSTSVTDPGGDFGISIYSAGGSYTALPISADLIYGYGVNQVTNPFASPGPSAFSKYALYDYTEGDRLQFNGLSATGASITAEVNTKNNTNVRLYQILKAQDSGTCAKLTYLNFGSD